MIRGKVWWMKHRALCVRCVQFRADTLHKGRKFREEVPPKVWHCMPNYAATQPSDSSHRRKLESLKTGNSRLYVRVTLYRKRIKGLNCFKHEKTHLNLSG